jgi:hypothetical protein
MMEGVGFFFCGKGAADRSVGNQEPVETPKVKKGSMERIA